MAVDNTVLSDTNTIRDVVKDAVKTQVVMLDVGGDGNEDLYSGEDTKTTNELLVMILMKLDDINTNLLR